MSWHLPDRSFSNSPQMTSEHRAIAITSYAIASSMLAVLASVIRLRITFVLIAASTVGSMICVAITQRSNLQAIASLDSEKQRPVELDRLSEELLPRCTITVYSGINVADFDNMPVHTEAGKHDVH